MDVDVTVRHSLVPQRRIERIASPSRPTMIVSTMVVMSVVVMSGVVMSVVVMAMIVKVMVVLGGGVRVAVMLMPGFALLPPGPESNPETEGDQSDAGQFVDHHTEALCRGGPNAPHQDTKQQRGHHMPSTGLGRSTRGLTSGPATLPRENSYRSPMVGDDRVKDAHGDHAGND
jgi:hypothetical protein